MALGIIIGIAVGVLGRYLWDVWGMTMRGWK